jgi:hypothetical protein
MSLRLALVLKGGHWRNKLAVIYATVLTYVSIGEFLCDPFILFPLLRPAPVKYGRELDRC